MTSTSILNIPQELTEHALVHADPCDVASFAQTCRTARALVYEQRDQHLWRRLFLEQPYDDPRRPSDTDARFSIDGELGSIDWKKALQQRVYAMRIIQKIGLHPPELAAALSTLISVARGAPPMLQRPDESKDLIWLNGLARENNVFGLATSSEHPWAFEELQCTSELWALIGWRDSVLNRAGADILDARNIARAFVYDMRNYARENCWGPFIPDRSGYVNWKHIEEIVIVIYSNLMDLGGLWPDTRPPARLDAIRAYSAPNSHTRDPRDWAGVEGTWRRYVCFMDYRDLFSESRIFLDFEAGIIISLLTRIRLGSNARSFDAPAFNYSTSAYEPSFFEDDEFQEATRLIELNLTIVRIGEERINSANASASSSRRSAPSSPAPTSPVPPSAPGPPFTSPGPARSATQFPVIYFVGRSRGGNGNESKVRGSVRMTPDGHIRWRFASIYDGQSQWSSEGIQIGGVSSAAGVVGTWTGAHHEEGDPAGPFWLWKVEDDHPSHLHSP